MPGQHHHKHKEGARDKQGNMQAVDGWKSCNAKGIGIGFHPLQEPSEERVFQKGLIIF
jgi:hypothetical protein